MAKHPIDEYIKQSDVCLTVADVARILNISKSTAYFVVGRKDFPSFRPSTRRIVIPRAAFYEWLSKQTEGICA